MVTRHEKVVLSLQDDFTTPMARAAAATALLDKQLKGLSGDAVQTQRTTRALNSETDGLGRTSSRAEKSIDKYSGRLSILGEVLGALGPAAIPIAGVAVPAIAGLAAQFGFAAAGAGITVLAFQGVGTALTALNKAALKPTAENLQAAKDAMAQISPEAQKFVRELRNLTPELHALRDLGAAGILPGFTDGLKGIETALPRVEAVVTAISYEIGSIGADLGGAIASGQADDFLNFLATEGPAALRAMAIAVGHTAHALANLWMAFTPLNNDFSDVLVKATRDFDKWTQTLSKTAGFQEFVDYLRTTGPQVADTLGAIGNAFVQIIQAAAPIGGPVLKELQALADVIAQIADSPLGTPIFGLLAAMSSLNLAVRALQGLSKATFGGPVVGLIRQQTKAVDELGSSAVRTGTMLHTGLAGAAVIGSLDLLDTTIDKLFHRDLNGSNLERSLTALGRGQITGALSDTFGKNLENLGGQADLLTNKFAAFRRIESDLPGIGKALGALSSPFGLDPNDATGNFEKLDQALTSLVDGGKAPEAAKQFAIMAGVAKQSGVSLDKFRSLFPTYEIAVDNAAAATDGAASAFDRNAAAQQRSLAKWQASKSAAALTGGQFITLGKDLDNAKISLDDWISELDAQATALNQFATNAKTAGERGLRDGLIKQLQAAGPAGALRLKQLADGTDAEIARANRAYRRGRRAIANYIEATAGLKPVTPDVNIDPAIAKIRTLQTMLDTLNGGKPKRPGRDKFHPAIADQLGGSDGNPKTAWASGGYTGPGPKYQPAGIVHRGEFVFSSEATRGNEAALSAMHSRLRGYADGGMVQPFASNVSNSYYSGAAGPSIDYDRLARAMSAVRPMYGPVHVSDGYGGFKAQMEADRRLSSLDGVRR